MKLPFVLIFSAAVMILGYQNCAPMKGQTVLGSSGGPAFITRPDIILTTTHLAPAGSNERGVCRPGQGNPDKIVFPDGNSISSLRCSDFDFIERLVAPNVASYQFFVNNLGSNGALQVSSGALVAVRFSGLSGVSLDGIEVPSTLLELAVVNSGLASASFTGGAGLQTVRLDGNRLTSVSGMPVASNLVSLANNLLSDNSGVAGVISRASRVDLKNNQITNFSSLGATIAGSVNLEGNPVCALGSTVPSGVNCGPIAPANFGVNQITSMNCYRQMGTNGSTGAPSPEMACEIEGTVTQVGFSRDVIVYFNGSEAGWYSPNLARRGNCLTELGDGGPFAFRSVSNALPVGGNVAVKFVKVRENCRGGSPDGTLLDQSFGPQLPATVSVQELSASLQNSEAAVELQVGSSDPGLQEFILDVACSLPSSVATTYSTVASRAAGPSVRIQGGRSVSASCTQAMYRLRGRRTSSGVPYDITAAVAFPGAATGSPPTTEILTASPAPAPTGCMVSGTVRASNVGPNQVVCVGHEGVRQQATGTNFQSLTFEGLRVQPSGMRIIRSEVRNRPTVSTEPVCSGTLVSGSSHLREINCQEQSQPQPSGVRPLLQAHAPTTAGQGCSVRLSVPGSSSVSQLMAGRSVCVSQESPSNLVAAFGNGLNQTLPNVSVAVGSSATFQLREVAGSQCGVGVSTIENLGSQTVTCEAPPANMPTLTNQTPTECVVLEGESFCRNPVNVRLAVSGLSGRSLSLLVNNTGAYDCINDDNSNYTNGMANSADFSWVGLQNPVSFRASLVSGRGCRGTVLNANLQTFSIQARCADGLNNVSGVCRAPAGGAGSILPASITKGINNRCEFNVTASVPGVAAAQTCLRRGSTVLTSPAAQNLAAGESATYTLHTINANQTCSGTQGTSAATRTLTCPAGPPMAVSLAFNPNPPTPLANDPSRATTTLSWGFTPPASGMQDYAVYIFQRQPNVASYQQIGCFTSGGNRQVTLLVGDNHFRAYLGETNSGQCRSVSLPASSTIISGMTDVTPTANQITYSGNQNGQGQTEIIGYRYCRDNLTGHCRVQAAVRTSAANRGVCFSIAGSAMTVTDGVVNTCSGSTANTCQYVTLRTPPLAVGEQFLLGASELMFATGSDPCQGSPIRTITATQQMFCGSNTQGVGLCDPNQGSNYVSFPSPFECSIGANQRYCPNTTTIPVTVQGLPAGYRISLQNAATGSPWGCVGNGIHEINVGATIEGASVAPIGLANSTGYSTEFWVRVHPDGVCAQNGGYPVEGADRIRAKGVCAPGLTERYGMCMNMASLTPSAIRYDLRRVIRNGGCFVEGAVWGGPANRSICMSLSWPGAVQNPVNAGAGSSSSTNWFPINRTEDPIPRAYQPTVWISEQEIVPGADYCSGVEIPNTRQEIRWNHCDPNYTPSGQ